MKYEARFAMNGMIIAIAVTEGIVGVFASILACRTLCSGGACQVTVNMPRKSGGHEAYFYNLY